MHKTAATVTDEEMLRTQQQIRSDFPILEERVNEHPLVYLDNGATTQKPKAVIDALSNYYLTYNSNVHRGVHTLSQHATQAYENARAQIQALIGAKAKTEIIFTSGTTDGINLVANCFGQLLEKGDEVLISTMEHHSNIVPWQLLCEAIEAKLQVIPLLETGEIDLKAYKKALENKPRVVAIAHVSNAMGIVNPVREMTALAHDSGAIVLVDGAQALPHMPVDVADLDCDFYAFSGHKCFGPTGIGVLYGKEKWLEKMPPYRGGGEMIKTVSFEKTTYNELPHKFEAGTPNIAGAIGLGAAASYVSEIGYASIQAIESDLLAYASNALATIDEVQVIGKSSAKVPTFSLHFDEIHPYDIGTLLDQMGIAVRTGHHCTEPLMDFFGIPGTTRASLAFYNNRNDIDRLIEGLKKAKTMLS